MKNRLKTLTDLEKYHVDMLAHVRAMIAAERGQPIKQTRHVGNNGANESKTPFADLTKADAVAEILDEKGEMHVAKIYAAMKRRGHPVRSKNALSNLLSTSGRFQKKGKGIWGLVVHI